MRLPSPLLFAKITTYPIWDERSSLMANEPSKDISFLISSLLRPTKLGHMSSGLLRWPIIPFMRVICRGLKVVFPVRDNMLSPASMSGLVLATRGTLCRSVQNITILASVCSRLTFLKYCMPFDA